MISWNHNRANYVPDAEIASYEYIPEGDYNVRIVGAVEAKSKKGNDMIELSVAVDGFRSKLKYFLAFLPNNPEITDQNLCAIWDSFAIPEGVFDLALWIGKEGAALVEDDPRDNGRVFSKIARFHSRAKQAELRLIRRDPASVPF